MDKVTKSITVKGRPDEVYAFWADFTHFPSFMDYIKEVTLTGENTSRWVMAGPVGMEIDWTAEVTRFEPNKRIAWNSKNHAGTITTSGQVTFNELPDNETEVVATVQYAAPGGAIGEALAKLFANPETRLEQDLRNFKQMVEGQLGTPASRQTTTGWSATG